MMKLPDLSTANAQQAAEFLLERIRYAIPNSSTKRSLAPEGYPVDGPIEQTIRAYQKSAPHPHQAAIKALESGCGNCQEMAYAGALILRAAGYPDKVAIGQYGINHQFLFIEKLIVDPWAGVYYLKSDWNKHITAYGGGIRDGIMHGRLVPPDHFEMEEEEPETIEDIPVSYSPALSLKTVSVIRDNRTQTDELDASDDPYDAGNIHRGP